MEKRRTRLVTLTTPVALLGIVALGTMIYLSGRMLRDPTSTPIKHETASAPPVQWSDDFQGRIAEITALLETMKLPVTLPTPVTESQGAGNLRWTHRRYDIELAKPANPDEIKRLLAPLDAVPPDVSVHDDDDEFGKQLTIGIDGLLTHTLNIRWRQRSPRMAIIVDSLGDDLAVARDLVALSAPLTFAVQPQRTFSPQVAERARIAGRDVLVDLPLKVSAAEGKPQKDLYSDAGEDAIDKTLDESLAAVPQAIGATAGLSAVYAKRHEHIQWVLERLKQRNIFLVESRAEASGSTCEMARSVGEPCVQETLRLDDSADESTLRDLLTHLREQAQTRGDLVVSARARPAVVAALRAELPAFSRAEVEIVPVSATLESTNLSRR